jgi:putative addiction module antidote
MHALKLTTVGSSLGFIMPKAAQEYMKVKKGDTVYLTQAPDNSFCLTPYSPEFERKMKLAERIMSEDREMLRMLAK